jgi:hypothetical protein
MNHRTLVVALVALSSSLVAQVLAQQVADPKFDTKVDHSAYAKKEHPKVLKGRVVVLGEAAMLSAQLGGPNKMPFGMNRPGADDR